MKTKKPLRSQELKELRSILREKVGYSLDMSYLIEQTFTRSSYSRRYGGSNNENLEFIGDTILGYHVVRQLYDHYNTRASGEDGVSVTFQAHEKDFTNLKNRIVSNHTLAQIIDEWDVCRFLIVGQSDIDNNIDKQDKIKADLLEAIIGAYAVQCNWDSKEMSEIISRILPIKDFIQEYEKSQPRDPKFEVENAVNTLKELAEHEECSFPEYDIKGPEFLGHNESGDPIWNCDVIIESPYLHLGVMAHSKKDAKRFAAYLALCRMFNKTNQFGNNRLCNAWYYDGKNLIAGGYKESNQK